ncbi:RNA/RNP complex-1-interacting phosphatase-like [Xenia sp. Carnegie-2017]|uniref:RNA/RNP complex-1-interacting phosphatase-like n=1 Tax=Xenia sp. Carnegie-2017 TaxID=2897299 RepID=UPI001F033C35|nr:RNA/RNP complex-1-interacting phosphatase-like [Xenia sp. Carnegie-2017]
MRLIRKSIVEIMAKIENETKKFTRIPAKWLDYTRCGKVIPGERLASFKTPLSENYHCTGNERNAEDCLQKDNEFTPKDLCDIFRDRGLTLGLVVDLTNTKRYYQPWDLSFWKVEYKKIKCEGKVVPSDEVVNRFKATVLAFLRKFPNTGTTVIGVHCTHGLNRSGYVVCRYLIECRGYSPQEAIEVFNKARGHSMERDNYLNDLKGRKPKTLSKREIDYLIESWSDGFLNDEKPRYNQHFDKCLPAQRREGFPNQPRRHFHGNNSGTKRCDDTRSTRRPSHDDPRLHRFHVDKFPDHIGFRCHERIPQLRYADSYEVNYLNNRVYPEDVYPDRRRIERRDYGPHGRRATGAFRDRGGYHWEARDPDHVEARRRQPIRMVQRHDVTYSSDEHYCRERDGRDSRRRR